MTIRGLLKWEIVSKQVIVRYEACRRKSRRLCGPESTECKAAGVRKLGFFRVRWG